jgi:hypothetical protein
VPVIVVNELAVTVAICGAGVAYPSTGPKLTV